MRWNTKGSPYPYRKNSLNLVRLLLAVVVLVTHAFYIAGVPGAPGFNGENLAGWAVCGFFVVSGFLITRSRFRTSAGDYLLHRAARIFPAFLVCLVVTAVVFGPLSLIMQGKGVDGYLSTPPAPLQYIWTNLSLYIRQYSIGETLASVPYPGAWNGSLWTLYFEFVCYVVTWVLGAFAIYRRSIAAIAAVWAISVGARFLTTMGVTGGLDGDFLQLVRLFGFFAGGALVYAIVDRFGLQTLIGVASVPIAGALMAFVPDVGGQLAAPFLGYALIFLATVVPQPTWISRNDVSYGFYIYAWPVQQLTILAGGMALGFPGYVALTVAITFVLAWASWVAVERPVMRRVRERPSPVVPVVEGQRA